MAWWTQGSGVGSLIPNKRYEYSVEFYFGDNSTLLFNALTLTMPKISAEVLQDSSFGKKYYDVGNISWEPVTITIPDFYHNDEDNTFSEGFRAWLLVLGMLSGKWSTDEVIKTNYEDEVMSGGEDAILSKPWLLGQFSFNSAETEFTFTDSTGATRTTKIPKGIKGSRIDKVMLKKYHGTDVIHKWILDDPMLISLGFGEMGYGSEELSTIEVMLQYSTAYYLAPGMQTV